MTQQYVVLDPDSTDPTYGLARDAALVEISGDGADWCGDSDPHERHDDEGTAVGRYAVHACPGVDSRRPLLAGVPLTGLKKETIE